MTYGEHQEAVAAALLRLLDTPATTAHEDEATVILGCHRQAYLAIHERLHELGVHRHLSPGRRTDRTIDAAQHPLHVLLRLVNAMPATPPGSLAPTDLLSGIGDSDTTLGLWRSVARHLTLGNADLVGAADQSWRNQAANWHLIGDLAVTVDALLVLDEHLGRAGLINRLPTAGYLERRLAAGDVARVAMWKNPDSSPDLAFAGAERVLKIGDGPRIHLVRRPEDFAMAQRALASFMRPRPASEDLDSRPGLLAARTISAGQVRLAEAFAAWAHRAGDGDLAERFRSRIPLYAELHRSTLRLVELQKTRAPLVIAQQSELVQQLRAHRWPRLSMASLRELDAATHELTVNVGKSLRREAMQRKNILVLDGERIEAGGGRPITNSSQRFVRASRTLADEGTLPPVGDADQTARRSLALALERPRQGVPSRSIAYG